MTNFNRAYYTMCLMNENAHMNDSCINSIYTTIKNKKDQQLNDRRSKLKYVLENIAFVEDTQIIKISEYIDKHIETNNPDPQDDKLQNTIYIRDDRYILILKIINEILDAINKPKINSLEDFIEIEKNLLETDEVTQIIAENQDEIIKKIGKRSLNMGDLKNRKNVNIATLNRCIKSIGLNFKGYQKSKTINGSRKVYTVYTILKN